MFGNPERQWSKTYRRGDIKIYTEQPHPPIYHPKRQYSHTWLVEVSKEGHPSVFQETIGFDSVQRTIDYLVIKLNGTPMKETPEPKGRRKENVDRVKQALEVIGTTVGSMNCPRSGDYHLHLISGRPMCIVGVRDIAVASNKGGMFRTYNVESEEGMKRAIQAIWTLLKKTPSSGNKKYITSKKKGKLERDVNWSIELTATYADTPFKLPGQDYSVFARFNIEKQYGVAFEIAQEEKTIIIHDHDTVAMVRAFLLGQTPFLVLSEYLFERNKDLNDFCNVE